MIKGFISHSTLTEIKKQKFENLEMWGGGGGAWGEGANMAQIAWLKSLKLYQLLCLQVPYHNSVLLILTQSSKGVGFPYLHAKDFLVSLHI